MTPGVKARAARQRRSLQRDGRVKRRYRLYPIDTVARVAATGMGRGLVWESLTRTKWDISGGCTDPQTVLMDGSPCRVFQERHVRKPGQPLSLTMLVRCRRCDHCLKRRRNLWAARASYEVETSQRTWMATFTFSPGAHARLRMRASARLFAGGTDLEALPDDAKFTELVKEYQKELTLYFKRVRKNSGGAKLRYILVVEKHKSGLPHYHALIHESAKVPVRHAVLTSAWHLGYTKFKLVNAVKTAWYVCKYLAKSVEARVRASIRYGSLDRRDEPEPTIWPALNMSCVFKPAPPKQTCFGVPLKAECYAQNETEPTPERSAAQTVRSAEARAWISAVSISKAFSVSPATWRTNPSPHAHRAGDKGGKGLQPLTSDHHDLAVHTRGLPPDQA